MSSSQSILDPVVVPLLRGKTILDVACGYGRWGSIIASNYWEAGMSRPPAVDGFDAFKPNVNFCSKLPFYRKAWQQQIPSELKGKWDTVLACEIIEHIPQEKVEETLDMLEKAAGRRIIISTPNWPSYRKGSATKFGFNKYEAHLSYVSRRMLKKRGYKIYGVGFANPDFWLLKLFRAFGFGKNMQTKETKLENKEAKLTFFRSLDLMPMFFPSLGHTIVAYKDVK